MSTVFLPDTRLLFSLLVESVGESLVLYLLAIAAFRLLKIEEAGLRSRFMLLPLVVPVVLGTVFHWLARPVGTPSSPKPVENVLHDLVAPLPWIEPAIIVIFGAAMLLAATQVLQGLATLILLRRRWAQQSRANNPTRLRGRRYLDKIAAGALAQAPRLIWSQIPGVHAVGTPGRLSSYLICQGALVQALDDEELEAVLAHEMAHLRQGHGPLTFVARLCRNLMWFNPAAHLAYRHFLEYQEQAADDGAVALTSNPLALASGLIKGVRFHSGRVPAVGSAFGGRSVAVERRIRRLIHYRPPQRALRQRWLLLGLALTSLLAFALIW